MTLSLRLPNSTIPTSRLGFGCAYLTGGLELRASRRLVDTALDAGYRHFDTAPLYGIGTAEDVLGAALMHRRSDVTIATKVGISRPVLTVKTQIVRYISRPLRRYVRAIYQRVSTNDGGEEIRNFSVGFVEASLQESFRRLRTDRVDLLLLHEIELEDITEELLTFLDKGRQGGAIGAIGIASNRQRISRIVGAHDAFFDVLQYSWSVFEPEDEAWSAIRRHVTHRALMNALDAIGHAISNDRTLSRQLSDIVGQDLADRAILSKILLGAAVARNRDGIVLVGARQAGHIQANAELIENNTFVEAGQQLVKCMPLIVKSLPTP